MPSKKEKQRRRQILTEIKEKEYREFINSIPLDKKILLKLFDYLDHELGKRDCDNDYKITDSFLKKKGIKNDKIFEWFKKNGGYCDCEILNNIEEKFE